MFLLGATQWCNKILILIFNCEVTYFLKKIEIVFAWANIIFFSYPKKIETHNSFFGIRGKT